MKLVLLIFGALIAAALEVLVIEVKSPKAHRWLEEESRGEVYVLLTLVSFALLVLVAW